VQAFDKVTDLLSGQGPGPRSPRRQMTISSLSYSHMATILMQPILDMARKVTPSPDRAARESHCPLRYALSNYAPTNAFSRRHCAPEDQVNKLAKRTSSQQLRSASKPTPQIQRSSGTGCKPCEPADPRRVIRKRAGLQAIQCQNKP